MEELKINCPKRENVICETPMVCVSPEGCRYNDDPIHPNRIPPRTKT